MNTEFALKNMAYRKGDFVMVGRYQLKLTSAGERHIIGQLSTESNIKMRQIACDNFGSFLIVLEHCVQGEIEENRADIPDVDFEFKGGVFKFSGLIPPGQEGAHYEWQDTDPRAK